MIVAVHFPLVSERSESVYDLVRPLPPTWPTMNGSRTAVPRSAGAGSRGCARSVVAVQRSIDEFGKTDV